MENLSMTAKEKLQKQKKAAGEIAEILLSSLQQFSDAEQELKIRRIENVKIRHKSANRHRGN
jgi:hypothetical protein